MITNYYAVQQERDGGARIVYSDIFRTTSQCRLCVGPDEKHLIWEIELREVREGDNEQQTHWGFVYGDDDDYSLIWPTRMQLNMCFPEGVDAAVKRGKGRIANLILTPIRPVYPKKTDDRAQG